MSSHAPKGAVEVIELLDLTDEDDFDDDIFIAQQLAQSQALSSQEPLPSNKLTQKAQQKQIEKHGQHDNDMQITQAKKRSFVLDSESEHSSESEEQPVKKARRKAGGNVGNGKRSSKAAAAKSPVSNKAPLKLTQVPQSASQSHPGSQPDKQPAPQTAKGLITAFTVKTSAEKLFADSKRTLSSIPELSSLPDTSNPPAVPWLDSHAPTTSEDLAVQRKKVQELKAWMQSHLPGQTPSYRIPRLLTLSGPPGCGKSTSVRVIASELGYEILEWSAEAPTLWSELQYQRLPRPQDGVSSYSSKLDDFSEFVARAKFQPLVLQQPTKAPSSTAGAVASSNAMSQDDDDKSAGTKPASKLLLLDDLPHAHDAQRRRQLCQLLRELATTSRCPVVLVATETTAAGSGDGVKYGNHMNKGLPKEVLDTLLSAGAGNISFNALTTTSITKALLRIASAENQGLSVEAATAIANSAAGDLRNAVNNLQMMFGGDSRGSKATKKAIGSKAKTTGSKSGPSRSRTAGAGGAGKAMLPHEAARLTTIQRDVGLQLFHALGKILYNKRDAEEDSDAMLDAEEGLQPTKRVKTTVPTIASTGANTATSMKAATSNKAGPRTSRFLRDMPDFSVPDQQIDPSLRRPPMRYDPESIVMKAGLEPLPLVSFLHANYTDFIGEEQTDDLAAAAEYLSEAGFLACYKPMLTAGYTGWWGEEGSSVTTLSTAAACSVATRGLLFANTQPVGQRFHKMQGPQLTHVDRAMSDNMQSLQHVSSCLAQVQGAMANGNGSAALAAEVLPYLRVLASTPTHAWLQPLLPKQWSYYYNGQVIEQKQQSAQAGEELASLLEATSLSTGLDAGDTTGTMQLDPIEDD